MSYVTRQSSVWYHSVSNCVSSFLFLIEDIQCHMWSTLLCHHVCEAALSVALCPSVRLSVLQYLLDWCQWNKRPRPGVYTPRSKGAHAIKSKSNEIRPMAILHTPSNKRPDHNLYLIRWTIVPHSRNFLGKS